MAGTNAAIATGTTMNGTYGTLGTAASSNVPPARYGVASWTDSSGNFYMFGGIPNATTNPPNFLNDLWKYSTSTNQWTWISGSNTINQSGTYGTLGTAAAANVPGARFNPAFWKDTSGNFWMFGGDGYDSAGAIVYLNDLWKYTVSTNQWTWIGGPNAKSNFGVYGTLGTAAASNQPGGRVNGVSWTDSSGNFWLFGGAGLDVGSAGCTASTCAGNLSDVWKYTPSTNLWVWVAGPNAINAAATYGTKGTAAAGNTPSGRYDAVGWVDSSNNLWLFGGSQGTQSTYVPLNDLWKFSTSSGQWTWVTGANTADAIGTYGTKGTAAASNTPGARVGSFTWVDGSGNLWLFGGTGHDSTNNPLNTLNDLWKFSTSSGQWTWVNGPNTGGGLGTYGTMGTSGSSNIPGSRIEGANWIDSSGNLWLFGGIGYGASGSANTLNDLWKYQP
jgi:N-acetylneuraminic acid mutarotase